MESSTPVWFYNTYRVRKGDTLSGIAQRFGFSDPGPIVKFPLNAKKRFAKPPYSLRPGDRVHVPYTIETLKTMKSVLEKLTKGAEAEETRLIGELARDRKKLEERLLTVDAIGMIANIHVGIGHMAMRYGTKEAKPLADGLRLLLKDFLADPLKMSYQASGDVGYRKHDLRFWLRLVEVKSPSWWATLFAALVEGDLDIALYGSAAVQGKTEQKIRASLGKHLKALKAKRIRVEAQLNLDCYRYRLKKAG